jgi:hypothetical protein
MSHRWSLRHFLLRHRQHVCLMQQRQDQQQHRSSSATLLRCQFVQLACRNDSRSSSDGGND